MNPAEWSGDRIIAALIVGGCTLSAALIKAYVEMRGARASRKGKKKSKPAVWKRIKSVSTAVIVAGGVTFGALVTGGIVETPNPVVLLRAATGPASPGLRAEAEADREPTPFSNWLKVEGSVIYYRSAKYLPEACPGAPTAHGSWAGGPDFGIAVRCVSGGWLAFDLAPLIDRGRIVEHITYCVNFRSADGVWGRHATAGAPGFDRIAVPSSRIPPGRVVGFRFTRGAPFDQVELTKRFPRAAC